MPSHSLRVASTGDRELILSLMKAFKEETPYSILETIDTEILDTIDSYLNLPKRECIVILYDDIGIIVGKAVKLPFNRDIQCCEVIWYVHPDHRDKKIGIELYEAFIYWATKYADAKVIYTASPEGSKLDKMYLKQEYTPLERVFIKVL